MKAILFFLLFFAFSFVCKAQNQMGVVGLGYLPETVSIIADNQVLNVAGKNYVRIVSNSATANTRTVLFTRGSVFGQQLTVEYVGTNTCEILDDSALSGGGNLRIAGNFNMNNYDVLKLGWNGVDWVQLARSAN
jgi:hypothetical protein